jgi:crotonobetainyl-CoA:carnitine CoA-transferase CaiB-like acyl-CoA transferase
MSRAMPLSGVKLIEWGEFISAPYCSRLLADLGADVIKVESPKGDASRSYGPFQGDVPDPEASGLFVALNAGKRSVVLDIDKTADVDALFDLVRGSDIFVTNQPGTLKRRLGLDAAALHERCPRLVTVGLSVFGETGPAADVPQTALDAYAVSGVAWVIGEPERSPLVIPFHQADYQAGAHGAAAATMALIARQRTGRGQHCDVASADILAAAAGTNSLIYLYYGLQRYERAGRRAFGSGGPYPYAIFPCKDGSVCLIGRASIEWKRLMEAMGNPEWSLEPRYQDLTAMGRDYPAEVDALIIPWLMKHTRAELLQLSAKYSFPVGPLRRMQEVVGTEQFSYRGFFRDVPVGGSGTFKVTGVPWRYDGEPFETRAAPRLGEHAAAAFNRV